MSLQAEVAIRMLEACLQSRLGIVITIEPVGDIIQPAFRAKQVLYRFKSEDARFANIQIRFSDENPDSELILLNTE